MGTADRTVRIIVALLIAALYYYKVIDGTLAYVLMALAAIFILTSFISFCPLYTLFGLTTCKAEK